MESDDQQKMITEWVRLGGLKISEANRLQILSLNFDLPQEVVRKIVNEHSQGEKKRPADPQRKSTTRRKLPEQVVQTRDANNAISRSEASKMEVRASPAIEQLAGCGAHMANAWGCLVFLVIISLIITMIAGLFS